MGILGPSGTHSEAAAEYLARLLPEPVELSVCPGIYEVLHSVEEGELATGLVPVENSLEGSVGITLDTLARSDTLEVSRELVWPVRNYLMAQPGEREVKRIYSHGQPLSQCRGYILAHYPHAELCTASSTARAAQIVADAPAGSGWAAICTRRGGELNGLVSIAGKIEDNAANSTRFFQVRRRGEGETVQPAERMLVICQIDGKRAGSLYEVLGEFARRGVNLTRIESRPARTELGAYIFFFDLETDAPARMLEESIEAVRARSIWLKCLGAFPVIMAQA